MKTKALLVALIPLALSACSSPSADISPEGTWGSDAARQPQLVLGDDGSVSGTDGCNRLVGSWKTVDDHVELSQLGSTMMACVDVDPWLAAASTLEFDGDIAHVFDATGTEVGTLDRQPS